jgi:two-component system, NtrC family, response regulator AtoC
MSPAPQKTFHDEWVMQSKDLLDSLNIGFMLLDMENNILDVNRSFCDLYGITYDEIVGHNAGEFYDSEEYQKLVEIDVPLQKFGNYQFEFFFYNTTGEKIPVLFNLSTNVDESGCPVTQYLLITDIREQKKVQRELEETTRALSVSRDELVQEKKTLEAILFGIGDCVTIFSPDGKLLLSNQRGKEIRNRRTTPLLALTPGNQEKIVLTIGRKRRHFSGRVEAIFNKKEEPYAFIEILIDITDHLLLEKRENELRGIKRKIKQLELKSNMIGVSSSMHKVFEFIQRCSEVDAHILIMGETGVGKELAARSIHMQSLRKNKPFVVVNCGALPETLLESELFGHVRGAFTGAVNDRPGLFREAAGGTLFLDEIGDIGFPIQVKLLRALQEKEIRPVGSDQIHRIDVRVISATHQDLKTMVATHRFREDLYYRIAVIPLIIPALRNRKEDIMPLVKHFIEKYHKRYENSPVAMDQAAQQRLLMYSWPGNIRELENCIEYAMAMAKGDVIAFNDLPASVLSAANMDHSGGNKLESTNDSPAAGKAPESLSHIRSQFINAEKEAILLALEKHNGNRSHVAEELGISRTTLWRKISMYQII